MKLVESILTKNPCYKAGRKITVKGLMLHSVGCPQPNAQVFIKNWNKASYDRACVHGFIDGNDGTVYQCLPWNHRGWHCGASGNNTHIGVEMCEPACIKYTIIDPDTFEMVQREMEKRGKGQKYHSGVHALSSKIRCGECGSWYGSKVWHSNSKYRKVIWQCNHKYDGDHHCSTPHLTDDIIQQAFLSAANKLLATKDTVIADGREMMALLFDTTDLEREQEELQHETQVVSDMVQQCIYENAHVALDQTEYQKRYDGLTERFEKAKARLDAVTAETHQLQTQRASIEDFLKAFAAMPDELSEFTLESWHGLVDYGTVYADDDIRFTFKNGQEVKA